MAAYITNAMERKGATAMKKILIITLFALMLFQITSFAEPMDRYKGFGEVFNETIGTSAGQIEYGMICFPGTGVNRTSNIEENDLKKTD